MAACAKGVCERVGERGQYHHSPISPSLFPNSGRPRNFGRIFRDVVTSDEHFALRVRYCVSSRLAAHIVSLPAHSLHPLGCHLAPYSVFEPGSATEISPPTAGEELEVAKSESWAKFKRRGSRYEKHFARCLGKISLQKKRPSFSVRSFATTVIFRRLHRGSEKRAVHDRTPSFARRPRRARVVVTHVESAAERAMKFRLHDFAE